jgi:hypothetical protein
VVLPGRSPTASSLASRQPAITAMGTGSPIFLGVGPPAREQPARWLGQPTAATMGLAHGDSGFSYFPKNYSNLNHFGFKPSKFCRNSNKFDKFTKPILLFEFKHIL